MQLPFDKERPAELIKKGRELHFTAESQVHVYAPLAGYYRLFHGSSSGAKVAILWDEGQKIFVSMQGFTRFDGLRQKAMSSENLSDLLLIELCKKAGNQAPIKQGDLLGSTETSLWVRVFVQKGGSLGEV